MSHGVRGFLPIATAKVEELLHELADPYTIAIVTHSMQQAARVSHDIALLHLGEPVESADRSQPSDTRTEDHITGRFG